MKPEDFSWFMLNLGRFDAGKFTPPAHQIAVYRAIMRLVDGPEGINTRSLTCERTRGLFEWMRALGPLPTTKAVTRAGARSLLKIKSVYERRWGYASKIELIVVLLHLQPEIVYGMSSKHPNFRCNLDYDRIEAMLEALP